MGDRDDVDTTIKIKLEKNILSIYQNPLRHGFWKLKLDKGALPTEYRGEYTKRALAQEAANSYIKAAAKE